MTPAHPPSPPSTPPAAQNSLARNPANLALLTLAALAISSQFTPPIFAQTPTQTPPAQTLPAQSPAQSSAQSSASSSIPSPSAPAPAPTLASASPSEKVAIICNASPANSYERRIRAIAKLEKTIPASDFFALQDFLERTPAQDPLTEIQLNAVKNDVTAKLLANDFWPDGFAKRFLSMASNNELGLMWQNYVLQFLDALWRREKEETVRKEIVETLIRATKDARPTIAETALLSLTRMEPEMPHEKPKPLQLGKLAVATLENPKIPWQDKITALHVAADAGEVRALRLARIWLPDETQPVMLRMAAIGVIGKRGNESDKQLLKKYSQSAESRLRKAAKKALEKMEKDPPQNLQTPQNQ